jgi:hypothetical protein
MECAMGRFNQAMAHVGAEKDAAKRKALAGQLGLPAYQDLFQSYSDGMGELLQTVNSAGGMGTVAAWQQTFHALTLGSMGKALSAALGEPLPASLQEPAEYKGPSRLIVPTVRSTVPQGERLSLRVIILSEKPPRQARLFWRVIGTGSFASADLRHLARGVYAVDLPPVSEAGIEYYLEATTDAGARLVFPPTAPRLNQTVVALPQASTQASQSRIVP